MRPGDVNLAEEIKDKLLWFDRNIAEMPGIHPAANLACLAEQIVDSVRRVKYVTTLRNRGTSAVYSNVNSSLFDPIKAALFFKDNNNIEEAYWLVFLFTHFGKNKYTGWGLLKGVYGALRGGAVWNWERVSSNFNDFHRWFRTNQADIKELGSFGNHRKYQSIDADKASGTGAAIGSYVDWIGETRSHVSKFAAVQNDANGGPREFFNRIYNSMGEVVSFGRTAKFDYLTMVGKLGLLPIEPGSTYMNGATGPLSGARLLFGGSHGANIAENELNALLNQLDACLTLYFGMQVLEDSLCNWQKSPNNYIYFNG